MSNVTNIGAAPHLPWPEKVAALQCRLKWPAAPQLTKTWPFMTLHDPEAATATAGQTAPL